MWWRAFVHVHDSHIITQPLQSAHWRCVATRTWARHPDLGVCKRQRIFYGGYQRILQHIGAHVTHSRTLTRGWWMVSSSVLFIGWYVLEVYDSLREFGERGVNHLLYSSSVKLWLHLQYWWGPPGSLFSYLSRSPLHCSSSKGGTSACNIVIVFLSIVNKRLWRQFLCGIYGCLDRVYSTLVR